MTSTFLALGIATFCCASDDVPRRHDGEYHTFWLTNARITAGETYGPVLLLSRVPLSQLEKHPSLRRSVGEKGRANQEPLLESIALFIETYRKDSIWNADGRPIKRVESVSDLDETRGTITMNGTRYRFDRAQLGHAIRLLENPLGKQHLHRAHAPLAGAKQTTRALALLLKQQHATADVGIIAFDKATQQKRSGDRFRIGVSSRKGLPPTIEVFIKKRDDEQPVRVDLTVANAANREAMIPVQMVPDKAGAGFYVTLAMTRDFAKNCQLGILVDSAPEGNVGTQYMIDLGSYYTDP